MGLFDSILDATSIDESLASIGIGKKKDKKKKSYRPPPRRKPDERSRIERMGIGMPTFGEFGGDVNEVRKGIVPALAAVAKAARDDQKSITRAEAPTSLLNLGGVMAAGGFGYQARALGEDPKKAPMIVGPDGKLYRNTKGGGLAHLLPFLDDVPDKVLKDARSEPRGFDLLKKDPLLVPLAFAPTAGLAGRSVAAAKIAKSLRKANPTMSANMARRIANREVNRPGYAKRYDIEGGIGERMITGKNVSEPVAGRMRSRSVSGRLMQDAYDKLSESIDSTPLPIPYAPGRSIEPFSRFGSSKRAAAAQARGDVRLSKKQENFITTDEINLRKALGRKWHQTLRNAPLTESQQDIMTGMIAAIEHGDMPYAEAVNARIKLYESILSGGISSKMTDTQIEKLALALERQMDDVTGEQVGQIGTFTSDIMKASLQADQAEKLAFRLATRRTPEEKAAIRDRLHLTPAMRRSEAEMVKLRENITKRFTNQVALNDRIEDLLTDPNIAPSKRNRGLSTATRNLKKESDALAALRKEYRDALAWGEDLDAEGRRVGLRLSEAENAAQQAVRQARGDADYADLNVQARTQFRDQRQEQSTALLAHEREKLDKAFDDMVANPRNSNPVSEVERRQIESSMAELKRALDHPTDTDEFRSAVQGMRELAQWVDEEGRKIAKMGKSDEEMAIIDQTFDARQDLIGKEMVRRGILTEEQAKGAYFPHYSMWQTAGLRGYGSGLSGPVASGPSLNQFILNPMENDLQLLQRGMVDVSPTTLGNILRNRLRYQSVHEAVRDLYKAGDDPPEDMRHVGKDMTLVRNPDEANRKVPDRMMMSITDPHRYEKAAARETADTPFSDEVAANADLSQDDLKRLTQKSADDAAAREQAASADPDGILDEMQEDIKESIYIPGSGDKPPWAHDTRNFKIVPTRVAKARLGDAALKSSSSDILATMNTINMLLRASILYAPYGGARYVTRNAIQNATLMALTQPGAFMNGKSALKMMKQDPELFRRIAVEGGTVAAQAGLPEMHTGILSGARSAERAVASTSSKVANTLGDIADEPFRVSAWMQQAKKYDFDTPEEFKDLLENPKHAKLRDEISQRVREDLYDFDAASPAERQILNRILFLYPFLRASAKWPFMYGREYPVRAAMAATVAAQQPDEREYKEVPNSVKESSTVDEENWSIWDPTGPMRGLVEQAGSIMKGVPTGQGGEGWLDNVNPLIGLALDYKDGVLGKDDFKRLMPWIRNWDDQVARPGGARDRLIRFMGMEIRPPKHIRDDHDKQAKQIEAALNLAGVQNGGAALKPVFDANKRWDYLNYKATRAGKDIGDPFEKAEISKLFAEFLRKNTSASVPPAEEMATWNNAQLDAWRRKMEREVWAPIDDPVSDTRTKLREELMKGYSLADIEKATGVDLSSYSDLED